MRLGYSDINMSTGPGIFIKMKKVNGELINIGSCRGPPAMPRGPPGGHGPLVENPCVMGIYPENKMWKNNKMSGKMKAESFCGAECSESPN